MQEFQAQSIRNVILVSHSGSGKTSLAEAMLFGTGAINRLGKVEDGTTTSDYEAEEIKRHSSIQTSVVPCIWKTIKINLLDTPGYTDFISEVTSAIRVADAAVVLVAAQSGVDVGTQRMWDLCEKRALPRVIFVNKMDRENADFYKTLASLQEVFGKKCVPIYLPEGSQQDLKSVINLLESPQDIPATLSDKYSEYRDRLVEAVAETNDELATKYLEGAQLSPEEVLHALKKSVAEGQIVPVIPGSATLSIGIKEIFETLSNYMPSPADVGPTIARSAGSDEEITLHADQNGPLSALVFKTTADPYVGKLSYFRVYSGSAQSDSQVWNVNKGQAERVGQLFVPRGKAQEQVGRVGVGDIGGVSKLSITATGDSFGQKDKSFILQGIVFPEPVFTVAVYPKSKADLDKMSSSLARLVEEDPSLRISHEADTAEILLSGMGDVQVEVAAERAKRKFGVALLLSSPKVPYKETITTLARTEYKHKKQSGGHGQYGHVFLELAPLPRGRGFEFGERVVGGNVPKEYIPAVEKGVTKALPEGVLAGFRMVDLRVVLYDGSSHPVDSSGMSFEIAGSHALKKGLALASPALLEPVMRLQVTVPDTFTGEVMGDLNSKRARILGMSPGGGITVIDAEAPMSEVLRYALDLRSLTQGRGSFEVWFHHYEEVPGQMTQRIIDQVNKERAEQRS